MPSEPGRRTATAGDLGAAGDGAPSWRPRGDGAPSWRPRDSNSERPDVGERAAGDRGEGAPSWRPAGERALSRSAAATLMPGDADDNAALRAAPAGAWRTGAVVRSVRSRSNEDWVPTRESLARVRVRVRVRVWAWVKVWAWVWVWVRGWSWGGFANRSKEDCVPSRRSLSKGRLAGGDGSVGVCVVVCGDSRPPGLG